MPLRPTPSTRPIRWPVLWLGAALAVTPGADARAVRVRAVEAETGRAVVGAIVVLLDSTSRPAARGLTNEGGRIVLAAPRN